MSTYHTLFISSFAPLSTVVIGAGGFIDQLNSFDDTRWLLDDGYGNGAPFLNNWSASQISFNNGTMTITLDDHDADLGTPLLSGSMRSIDTYQHGYFESRLKASNVPGTIAGFFLYTGPPESTRHDEIDVEIKGDDPTKVQVNYWTNGVEHPVILDLGFDASEEFHTYGIKWLPNVIEWYVDGELIRSENGSVGPLPTTPCRLFVNFWATFGVESWSSNFNEANVPAFIEIDSISYNPTAEVLPEPAEPVISEVIKGIAYYRSRNDISTGLYALGTNFVGSLKFQGTLLDNPTEADWADITESVYIRTPVGPLPEPTAITFNFKGNFVKLRGVLENFVRGSIVYVRVGY